MKLFNLYLHKEFKIVKIEPVKFLVAKPGDFGPFPTRYNQNLFISTSRESLIVLAHDIIKQWIAEAEKELEELKQVKIDHKY